MPQETTLFALASSPSVSAPKGEIKTPSVVPVKSKPSAPKKAPANKSKPVSDSAHETLGCAASVIFDLAVAVEAQEKRIKETLKQAAASGDLPLVKKILDLWTEGPVAEVLLHLDKGTGVQGR